MTREPDPAGATAYRAALTPDRALLLSALAALAAGAVAALTGRPAVADALWAAGIAPSLLVLLLRTVRALARGETGVDVLAALSMGGALLLGERLAGVIVALMYAGGTVLEELAGRHAARELTALLARAPRVAHVEGEGALRDVDVAAVRPGDLLLVKPGEVLPVDGTVAGDAATLDEAALSGEALPVTRRAGEAVRSGALNAGPAFRLLAAADAARSTYAGIVRLVEAARAGKAPLARLADRYALVLLPASLALAGLAWLLSGDPLRALAVLVVATPCPLILAAPVAIVGGVSAAARRGVLVKGGGPLEALARVRTLVVDKTGTITTGVPRVAAVEGRGCVSGDELLRLAASLDQASQHPMAAAIVAAARARGLALAMPEAVRETHGLGIEGRVGGRMARLGAPGFASGPRAGGWGAPDGEAAVLVSVDDEPAGVISFADEIRADTPGALRALRRGGVRRVVLLSGDRTDVAEAVAAAVGVDAVLAERSPADKVDAVRAERAGAVTAMVGDGVNDAPALAAADVGVAMGARGAAAAAEAADVVLLVDRLDRLAEGIAIARRTLRIALQSVLAGMALSGLGMAAAAAGLLPPVAGAVLQEAIDVAAILNALRAAVGGGARRGAALPAGEARALRAEHAALVPVLDRLRALADALGTGGGPRLRAGLLEVDALLADRVLPHERGDEAGLHPRLAALLGGRDPLAAISRTHREIAHLARRLHRLTIGMPPQGPAPADVPEMRRLLYGLEAILRLHFAQEDELYDSVAADEGGPEPAAAGGASLADP